MDKRQAVLAVLKEGRSVTAVAKELGVARKTIYAWIKKYKTASPNKKSTVLLENNYRKGKDHPRSYRHKFRVSLTREVARDPSLSATQLSKKLRVGRHAVVNLLKELELSRQEDRESFARLYKAPGRLHSDIKGEIVRKVIEEKRSISEVSREYGVARKTIYGWIKRYEEEGRVSEKYVSGFNHPKAFSERDVRIILNEVVKAPELSIHKLAENLGLSAHGIYNVLKRYNLTYKDARLAYAEARRPVPKSAFARFLNQVRLVLEQFIPTLAPAPPPEKPIKAILPLFRVFFASAVATSIFSLVVIYWMRLLGAASPTEVIGLSFATVALFMGSVFFLYSFKYYITLAIVLSFSQQEAVGRGVNGNGNAKKRNFLSWILGLANGNGNGNGKNGRTGPVGLEPNLERVTLKRHPMISIHIPFYNEKNVVERAIEAATNFDYKGKYEVILADDSTDQTTTIIRDYQKKHLAKGERLKEIKGDGWTLTSVEVKPGVVLKHLHRTSRSGFKGGALKKALELTNPKAEFVSVFDADFVPYPDTLDLFLKYFKVQNNMSEDYKKSNVAVIQGYQWHVLNKSENWITRGIRSEYAGSYVIERSGREIYGALKQISGAVYMIRRDVLEEVGWETSITEDFQLTLKLYEKGYKVVYTPYIQAPAECVSTLKRLIRQRMRWAEGHSNNIRKMFARLVFNDKLTLAEKFEFLYLSPYYLQAFLFLVGTISWLISETIFPARLPFWTSLWGWSLVLTNLLSLPLMNAVGLFLEESEEKDYQGLASFVALSYILVPFQAYASLKGFLEKEEGPWFRTPKTGRITDVFTRGKFYRFISGIIPGRGSAVAPVAQETTPALSWASNPYVKLTTANNKFNSFGIKPKKTRWIGKIFTVFVVVISLLLGSLMPLVSLGKASIENRRLVVDRQEESPVIEGLTLTPEKQIFSSDEEPTFTLEIDEEKVEESILGISPKTAQAADAEVETSVFYRGRQINAETEVNQKNDGNFDIRLKPARAFMPGRYTLQTTVLRGGAVYQGSQDFTWGVLAINTNKSIYLPGENAKLSLAVLDEDGKMVCNADLKLTIKNQELGINDLLSTEEGTIQVNPECRRHKLTQKPDYEAEYQVGGKGRYEMELTAETANGTYTINDSFEVRESIAFDIERSSATRIYPVNPYPVALTITAYQDFKGTVEETVPASFEITERQVFSVQPLEEEETQKLVWEVDWKAGETYNLSYEFKAPKISPQFYLLGPLRIGTRVQGTGFREVFRETRQWQIASDAVSVGTITTGVGKKTKTITISNHVVSGTDVVLYVFISAYTKQTGAGLQEPDSVVWNGNETLTQVGFINTNKMATMIYRYVNPTATTANVVISDVNNNWSWQGAVASAVTVTGVNQTTPDDGYNSNSGTSSTSTVNVSSATNDLVFDVTSVDKKSGGSCTVGSGQTEKWNTTYQDVYGCGSTEPGATSVTMDWSLGASVKWSSSAISINPAAASTYEQSAYRWYANTDTATAGSPLANNNTPYTLTSPNQAFRLRALIHIGSQDLGSSGENFKLQFAERVGTCDTSFTDESYADVTTTSAIRYKNNSPADDVATSAKASGDEPDHAGHTRNIQSYEEYTTTTYFTNNQGSITAGDDGLWDFALEDNNAGIKTFCFRILINNGTQLDTYTVIPEISTVPENEWILFGSLPLLLIAIRRKKRLALKRVANK